MRLAHLKINFLDYAYFFTVIYQYLFFQIQKAIEERLVSGRDTTSLDDEAFNLETSLDRCILRLIASCCNGKFPYK